jgi:hypothetical protein
MKAVNGKANRTVYHIPTGWYSADQPHALDVRGPFVTEAEAKADSDAVVVTCDCCGRTFRAKYTVCVCKG